MKRVLCVLLCVVLCLSMVACGSKTEEVVSEDETYWVDDTISGLVSDDLSPSESVGESDDFGLVRWDEELMWGDILHPELSDYMGSVSGIYSNVNDLQFKVGADIYGFNYGELEKQYTLSEAGSVVYTVSNAYFSQLIFEVSEGGIVNCFDSNGDCLFKGLKLKEVERILDCGSSYVYVVAGEKGNYTVKLYCIQEDKSVVLEDELPVVGYSVGDYVDMEESVKEEYWFRSDVSPWELYVVTENGHLYMFNDVDIGYREYKFCIGKNFSNVSDVDEVFGSVTSGVEHYAPVYSKVGDDASLYTLISGESLWDTEDDVEVKIAIPNGYSTANVRKVIGCVDSIVIMFDDYSVYVVNDIDGRSGEYTAEIISGLTELNEDGKLLDIEGMWYAIDRIYVLLVDGVVYYIDL